VALLVADIEACVRFYTEILGFRVEWRPDPDNAFLTSGRDNLALHKGDAAEGGALDHLGLLVDRAEDVDSWAAFLASRGVAVERPPRTHRDGARSLYLRDPCGNLVQILFHPPISAR
jgi:catechol 2,3-dioxygenase-like lactoylglutathione lyase family enzyme